MVKGIFNSLYRYIAELYRDVNFRARLRSNLLQLALIICGLCVFFGSNVFITLMGDSSNFVTESLNYDVGLWRLFKKADFAMDMTLFPHSDDFTILEAILMSILNGFLIAIIASIFAILIGIGIGAMFSSTNKYLNCLAFTYVNIFRSTPVFILILIISISISASLPDAANRISLLWDNIFITNRAISINVSVFIICIYFFICTVALSLIIDRQKLKRIIMYTTICGLILFIVTINIPRLQYSVDVGIVGGISIYLSIFILIAVLSMYTGAYIAHIFYISLKTIAKGQFEASNALGMHRHISFINILIPQSFMFSFPSIALQILDLCKFITIGAYLGISEICTVSIVASSSVGNTIVVTSSFIILYFMLCSVTITTIIAIYNALISKKMKFNYEDS